MTEERRYGINWVDLFIKVILLVLFVLLICWLFPMPKLDTFYDKVFNENIQTMKEAARNYYTVDRLPKNIGETKNMTLEQMVNSKLILEFSDKDGKTCDTANSYVQVTKTLDSEYALKVQLSCGDETDYIIDTIGCNGTCLLSEVNNKVTTTNVAKDDDSYTDVKLSSGTGSNASRSTNNYYYYPLGGGQTSTTTIVQYPESSNKSNTTRPNWADQLHGGHAGGNNTGSGNSGSSGSQLYYQQAKIVKSYGSWIQGYRTGNNIQTKTERVNYYYYTYNTGGSSRTTTNEYRTTSYITPSEYYYGNSYSYEVQLTNIPSTVNSVTLNTTRYFSTSDYQKYLNDRDVNAYMSGNDMTANSHVTNATQLSNSSLKSTHFSYSVSNPYKSNGVWRVRVTISIKNKPVNVAYYYDRYLNKDIYFVPVYFKVNVSGNSGTTRTVLDTEANAYKYNYSSRRYAYTDTVNYYRTINEYVDYNQTKWSTSRYLDGYQFTGNTKYM